MSMFCHQCGKPVRIDAKFCGECGTRVVSAYLSPDVSEPNPTPPISQESDRSVSDWPVLGATLGKCTLLPYIQTYFVSESDRVERSWGWGRNEDATVDMLLTDYGILFSPSPDNSPLKKAGMNVFKHADKAGMVLGSGGALLELR